MQNLPSLPTTHLDYVNEDPVCDEPAEDVDQVEADGVRPEQDVGGEGGEGTRQHALRERF